MRERPNLRGNCHADTAPVLSTRLNDAPKPPKIQTCITDTLRRAACNQSLTMLPLYGHRNAARTVEACFLLGRSSKHFAQQRKKLRNDTGPHGLWTLGRVDRLLCRGRLVVPLSPLEK